MRLKHWFASFFASPAIATFAVALMVVVSWSPTRAMAQSVRELDVIEALGRKEAGLRSTDAATHKKLTAKEAMRVRIMEVMAGERAFANRMPDAEIIVGPPLEEREQIIQVLNRMAFGATPGQIDEILMTGGWQSWIETQLAPDTLSDSKLDKILYEKYPWTQMSLKKLQEAYPLGERGYNQPQLRKELPESVILRAATSNRQFKEVMCDFWRNHLSINQPDRNAPKRSWTAAHYEENVIRKHAFGHIEDMLLASARHPGMLEFLDNYVSRKGAWNENYARELMELHTLGADRYYNEQDVLELSLILTGWSFNDGLSYTFRGDWHDTSNHKVLGKRIPPGEQGGVYAIKMLAAHPGTAKYLSEKLCRYLVNDNPPKSLVNKAVQAFRKRVDGKRGHLPTVYRTIVTSDEFFSRSNYKAKFKTPFEFTVSALRATGAKLSNLQVTNAAIADMGQPIYNCDDPTGYYDFAEAWLDAGVLTRRWNYVFALIYNRVPGVTVSDKFYESFAGENGGYTKRVAVKSIIGGQMGDATGRMLDEVAKSGDVKRVLAVILGSPSFQQQ
jgi:uncharacterized protein (DUF1800 family)